MVRALVLLAALWPLSAPANPIEVDVELFLAVDVSRSMAPSELEIQRRGYAEALTSPEVMAAIRNGMLGRIAITYVEWAASWSHRVIIPWQTVETPEQARAIAERLTADFSQGMRRTSIGGVIGYATDSLRYNNFNGLRRVIDVSGDGPNNEGPAVTLARDRALGQGIVINGLPLMTQDGVGWRWHLENLDWYYEDCVIGGPGAFVIPVTDWREFAGAVRRKLVLELVGLPPAPTSGRLWRAQARAPMDCLVGEKRWEQRRQQLYDEF